MSQLGAILTVVRVAIIVMGLVVSWGY